jgi:hypothetical protein
VSALKPRTDLVVDVWGDAGSGKTFFAANAAGPRGLYYQTLEARRSNDVLAAVKGEVVVGEYESEIPPSLNRTAEVDVKKFFQVQLTRFKNDLAQALKLGAGIVVWDKAIDLWEVIRYSHFGKLMGVMQLKYGPANSEFVDLASMPAHTGATLIMVNEEEEEWVTTPADPVTGKTSRQSTGRMLRKAQNATGYLSDISLRMYKTTKPTRFFTEIMECKPEPSLIGSVHENLTFEELASMVRPAVDWSAR